MVPFTALLDLRGTVVPHPTGTRAVLIATTLVLLVACAGTWRYLRPVASAPRRPFARVTVVSFGVVAAWLILVPILFRIFDLPGSRGPIQVQCGDPVALQVFHARGLTFALACVSVLCSPLLGVALWRLWREPGARPRIVAAVWAFGVLTRMIDMRFAPTV